MPFGKTRSVAVSYGGLPTLTCAGAATINDAASREKGRIPEKDPTAFPDGPAAAASSCAFAVPIVFGGIPDRLPVARETIPSRLRRRRLRIVSGEEHRHRGSRKVGDWAAGGPGSAVHWRAHAFSERSFSVRWPLGYAGFPTGTSRWPNSSIRVSTLPFARGT